MSRSRLGCLGIVVTLSLATARTHADDWPQWQGPTRTAISKETGLLKAWPKDGPPLAWKATELGGGFSTPSVADGKIFGMSYRGADEVVWALEEKTGKPLWTTRIAASVKVDHGQGSRSTPTFDNGKLYAVGITGALVCLNAADGKSVWEKNLPKDFGGGRPGWGYSESVLIDGDKLVCTPGGKNTIVALDKATGETLWKATVPPPAPKPDAKGVLKVDSGANGAHYSSVAVAEIAGRRQYLQFLRGGVVSVGASDGEFLWRYDAPANGTANCATPIFADDRVFAASAYGTGGGSVKVSKTDSKFEATQVFFDKALGNHHGGFVLVNGYLYGEGNGRIRCVDFKTGKIMWDEGKTGKGSVSYADGHLYYRDEKGPIFLIEANPKEYVEKGRFAQPERSKSQAWAHPVIANGKLYILDQDVLLCFDIKGK